MRERKLIDLFDSTSGIRILKLFLRNPDEDFSAEDLAKRSRVSRRVCSLYIRRLLAVGLIKKAVNEKKNNSPKGEQKNKQSID